MPVDRTWAPEVVESVGRAIDPERWAQIDAMNPNDRAFLPLVIAEKMRVDAALDASPLREALDLIERLVAAQTDGPDGMELSLGEVDQCIEDGLVLLARVNAREGGVDGK